MSGLKKYSTTGLGLLVGLGALPGAALAANGWYVGGSIGANLVEDQDWKVDYANNTATRRDGQFAAVDLQEGWIGGLNTGFAFTNGLRIEAELQRRRNEISTIDLAPVGLFNQGGPASSPQGALIADTLFVNVWYDLFKAGRWHPYLGGGYGMAMLKVKDAGYAGTRYRDDTDEITGYQLGAGLGFDLKPNVTISLDYRYLDLDSATYDLLGSSQPSSIKLKYKSDSIMFGVRYSFGGSSAEAMPEVEQTEESVQVVDPVDAEPSSEETVAPAEVAPESAAAGCEPPAAGDLISLDGCKAGETLVLRGVNFESSKAVLTSDATTTLDPVSDKLKAAAGINVEISGHTDSQGNDAYNQTLSEERAEAVKQYLVERGVDGSRMSAQGYGETQPVADNSTEEGRQLNRRVELRVLNEASSAASPVESSEQGLAEVSEAGDSVESAPITAVPDGAAAEVPGVEQPDAATEPALLTE